MNICNKYTALLILAAMLFQACATPGAARRPALDAGVIAGTEELSISALGAIGPVEIGPMFIGDGGRDITLAVLVPGVQGDVPDFLPNHIQGMLNNNINRFSGINPIDRIRLGEIMAELALGEGDIFSQEEYIGGGYLIMPRHQLIGTIQRLPGDNYSLNLHITDIQTGMIRATFMESGTLTHFLGRGELLNRASLELLGQLGVQLTEAGRQTLLAGNVSAVQAEAGLARGLVAQAGGDEVAALFNFAQAHAFDPGQFEAATRLNTLTATITGGTATISQRILFDALWRDQWIEAFREAASFFDEHSPFEIIFDPSLIQIGETDFARRTVNLGMRIVLDPSRAAFGALNSLLGGLEGTGRRDAWGFSGWPLMDISPRTAGTVVLAGRRTFRYTVDVALVNENNVTLGTSRITLNADPIGFTSGDRIVTPPDSVYGVVYFPNIRAEDLTPTLNVMIVSVNGIRAHDLIASSYIRVEAGNLEARARRHEAAELAAQQQQEQMRRERRQGFWSSSTGMGLGFIGVGVVLAGGLVLVGMLMESIGN